MKGLFIPISRLVEITLPSTGARAERNRERARRKNRSNSSAIARIFPRTKAAMAPAGTPATYKVILNSCLRIHFIIVWVILFGWIGCAAEVDEPIEQAGTDTGNAIVMGLSITGADPAEPSDIDIEDAWMGLDNLRFYNCNDGEQASVFRGPFAVDLSVDNALGDAEAASTAICRVDIQFHAYPETDATHMLAGRSLYLAGRNGNQLPFEVSSDRESTVVYDLEPIELTTGNNAVMLRFDPHVWMEGIDFNTAELTDGVALIDEMHNRTILDSIHQHMMQNMGVEHHMENSEMMDAMSSNDRNHMP